MKKKTRKRIRLGIICLVIAVIIYIVIRVIIGLSQGGSGKSPVIKTEPIETYVYSYAPNYHENVDEDPGYAEKDQHLYYTEDAITDSFTLDESAGDYRDELQFFLRYFSAVRAGDWDTYQTLFTDDFAEKAGNLTYPTEPFTPQKIYNMRVSFRGSSTVDSKTVSRFSIQYCIYHNNGTFCNFIKENQSREIYCELISDGKDIKIRRLAPFLYAEY